MQTYLPTLAGNTKRKQSDHVPNAQEFAVFELAGTYPEQQRAYMALHPLLCQVARARAQDMAERAYFGHTDLNGHGPNWHVRQAGYRLPNWYGTADDANNVESIAAGQLTAQQVWDTWLASPSHRRHVLGESDFYRAQTNVGIGYYLKEHSAFWRYWTFVSAPPE